MSRAFRGLYKRFTASGEYTWYIDKCIKRVGRLCESTGTADRDEAERYLLHRIRELRDIAIYGVRPGRKFHEAAAKYLTDFALKSTIRRDAAPLKDLEPYIGDLWLDQINNDSFNAYRKARQDLAIITRNAKIATSTLKRSVFVLPADFVKGKRARVVVLNDRAQSILEELRGQHRHYVFTSKRGHSRRRLKHVIAASWRGARARAAQKYRERFGTDSPEGFRRIRVHDLRHTFGRRLRAAGVSLEDRQDLLGHKRQEITTHYSAAEVGHLIQAANRTLIQSTASSATLLRVAASLAARPRRSRPASQETGTTRCLGLLPQNSLANFKCVRGMPWKGLVGADGLEPPTFAL